MRSQTKWVPWRTSRHQHEYLKKNYRILYRYIMDMLDWFQPEAIPSESFDFTQPPRTQTPTAQFWRSTSRHQTVEPCGAWWMVTDLQIWNGRWAPGKWLQDEGDRCSQDHWWRSQVPHVGLFSILFVSFLVFSKGDTCSNHWSVLHKPAQCSDYFLSFTVLKGAHRTCLCRLASTQPARPTRHW